MTRALLRGRRPLAEFPGVSACGLHTPATEDHPFGVGVCGRGVTRGVEIGGCISDFEFRTSNVEEWCGVIRCRNTRIADVVFCW